MPFWLNVNVSVKTTGYNKGAMILSVFLLLSVLTLREKEMNSAYTLLSLYI